MGCRVWVKVFLLCTIFPIARRSFSTPAAVAISETISLRGFALFGFSLSAAARHSRVE
jgi:hypothetical protein